MFRNATSQETSSTTDTRQSGATQRLSTDPTSLPVASSDMADVQEPSTEPASPSVVSSEMSRTEAGTTQPARTLVFRPKLPTPRETSAQSASPSAGSSHMVSAQDAAIQNNTTRNPAPNLDAENSSSDNSNSTSPNPAAPAFFPQTRSALSQISTAPATHQSGISRLRITASMASRVLDGYQENFRRLNAKIQELEREVALLKVTEQVNNEEIIQEKEAEIESHKRYIDLLKRVIESQHTDLEHLKNIFELQEDELKSLKDEIAEASWTIEVHIMKEARRLREQRDLGPVGSKPKSAKDIEKLKEEVADLKARNKELNGCLGKQALYLENKELKKKIDQQKYTANLAVDRSSELIAEAEEKCEQKVAVLKKKIEDLEFKIQTIQTIQTSGGKDKYDLHCPKGKSKSEGEHPSDEARVSGIGAPVLAVVGDVVISSQPTSA